MHCHHGVQHILFDLRPENIKALLFDPELFFERFILLSGGFLGAHVGLGLIVGNELEVVIQISHFDWLYLLF